MCVILYLKLAYVIATHADMHAWEVHRQASFFSPSGLTLTTRARHGHENNFGHITVIILYGPVNRTNEFSSKPLSSNLEEESQVTLLISFVDNLDKC